MPRKSLISIHQRDGTVRQFYGKKRSRSSARSVKEVEARCRKHKMSPACTRNAVRAWKNARR